MGTYRFKSATKTSKMTTKKHNITTEMKNDHETYNNHRDAIVMTKGHKATRKRCKTIQRDVGEFLG